MAASLTDLVEEWLHYHPKLYNHFKVEKVTTTENPSQWPFDQDACIVMSCYEQKSYAIPGAVALIGPDFVYTGPLMAKAVEPNFFKNLEDWLIAYHNSNYHQI